MTRRIARLGAVSFVGALLASALVALGPAPAGAATGFDARLTRRAPYLTDLVAQHVIVNWATDRSATTGSLKWGTVSGTTCSLTNTQTAVRASLTVGSVGEYRWTASLSLPSSGSYCYRPMLAATDLLGTAASPRFKTQVPVGSTESFSFGVFGDWGRVDANGNAPEQANLMSQIAASGVRFALTTGDNGYPSGSQVNYGDLQQKGKDTSAIFGPSFWTVAGGSVPLFTSVGNHGLSGTTHADLTNWPQDVAVSSSGGRYQNDVYCCVNGSTSSNYASEWYAFDAGLARFYVLTAAWGDTNPGSASVYANDAAAHWAPTAAEYQWLQHDLQAHPSGMKFAVFHYPLYSDNNTESSDVPLQAALEPLLKQYGVGMAFNGHAHVYERNLPSSPGAPVTYTTGGGGGVLEPIGHCHAYDAYAIGWSPTSAKGSACGSAAKPTTDDAVFHFLKVTVNGNAVTVAPTDSLGHTFDVQTYNLGGGVPDTVIDTPPPPLTSSTSASVAFHATATPATYACALDGGAFVACTSPATYSTLGNGAHTVQVRGTTSGGTDPTPASATWTVDTVAPTTPAGVSAVASSPNSVTTSWSASSDANGIAGYDVLRGGSVIASVSGTSLSYTDPTAVASTTYTYAVRARDGAGNPSAVSSGSTVTTPSGAAPVFSDGFETGTLAVWTSSAGLTVQGTTVHGGSKAAEGNTTAGNTYAKKTLPATYTDGFGRVYANVKSAASQVNLLRFRTAADGSLGYLFVTPTGQLGFRNDVAATTTMSATVLSGGWHALELHLGIAGTSSVVEVWADGVPVADLSSSAANLGTTPIGRLQIGEVQSGRTYDVVFDDAAFGTQRIGL